MNEKYAKLLDLNAINDFNSKLSELNHQTENQMNFKYLNINNLKQNLVNKLNQWLEKSINHLKDPETSDKNDNLTKENCYKCICECLTAIRIISRDKESIDLAFNNNTLLSTIKDLAGLSSKNLSISTIEEEEEGLTQQQQIHKLQINELNYLNLNSSQQNQEIIILSLKAISNLIYNSKHVQEYYTQHTQIIDALILYIKEFNIKFYNNYININIFNMRILFLLTAYNLTLYSKLNEVLIYLIEIIDQIIKERLNEQRLKKFNNKASADSMAGKIEYCYLSKLDIDYLIELLKVLYNLTMDNKRQKNVNGTGNEEYEAHLMRLVSVLRDLLTCKEEIIDVIDENQEFTSASSSIQQNLIQKTKLDDLHSNIINALTNMPEFCYEELLIPINTDDKNAIAGDSDSRNRLAKRSKYYIKSKQLKLQQQQQRQHNSIDPDGLDRDYEYEGKNMESISIILKYLKKALDLYLQAKEMSKKTSTQHLVLPHIFVGDHLQPILLLLIVMSKSNFIIRKYCRLKVLPPLHENDVMKLPTQGNRLRNKLACLMTDANTQVKHLSEQFLYILCKENIGRLIKYLGFGNAAGLIADIGFLKMNSKINGDGDDEIHEYSSDSESSDTEEYERIKDYVNRVTGRYEKDQKNLFDNLTIEQKEYVAHELMCTVQKLSNLGIIKPAGMDENGKLKEFDHVLEIPDYIEKTKNFDFLKKKLSSSNDTSSTSKTAGDDEEVEDEEVVNKSTIDKDENVKKS